MKIVKLILINLFWLCMGFLLFSVPGVLLAFCARHPIWNALTLIIGIIGAGFFEFLYFYFLRGILREKRKQNAH